MAGPRTVEHLPSLGFKVWRTQGLALPHPHVHPDVELLIVERGRIDHYQVGGDTRLEAGSLQCLWAGLPHGSTAAQPGTRFTVVCLPIEWLIDHPATVGLVQALLRGRVVVDQAPAHVHTAVAWARDFATRSPLLRQAVRHEILACLLRLAARHGLTMATDRDGTGDGTAQRHALHMAHHILAHYREDLDVTAVARSEGLSRGHALLVFKQVLGVGIGSFILQVRITQALGLLVEDRETVASIAFRVGFHSLSTFNDAFRRVVGHSPREYRKRAGDGARR